MNLFAAVAWYTVHVKELVLDEKKSPRIYIYIYLFYIERERDIQTVREFSSHIQVMFVIWVDFFCMIYLMWPAYVGNTGGGCYI